MSIRQGRYVIRQVIKSTVETQVTVAVAIDTQANDQRVVLKRWECTELPLARRAKELVYYEHATEAIARLKHPLIPRVLDRFVEGQYYYVVLSYADGESLAERLQKLLRPTGRERGAQLYEHAPQYIDGVRTTEAAVAPL